MKTKLGIGTISHGTLRTGDVATALLDVLADCSAQHWREFIEHWEIPVEALDDCEADFWDADPFGADVLFMLFEELATYAPALCSVGAHPGDGSDIGVWPDWGAIDDGVWYGEVLKVEAGTDWHDAVPELRVLGQYHYVLEVNERGSATLWGRNIASTWVIEWETV